MAATFNVLDMFIVTDAILKITLMCVLIGQLAAQPVQACEMSQPQPMKAQHQSSSMAQHEDHQGMNHDMHQGHSMVIEQVTMDMACCDDCQCVMNLCHSNWLLNNHMSAIKAETPHNALYSRQAHRLYNHPDSLFRPPIV